jgi:hypothetical protein
MHLRVGYRPAVAGSAPRVRRVACAGEREAERVVLVHRVGDEAEAAFGTRVEQLQAPDCHPSAEHLYGGVVGSSGGATDVTPAGVDEIGYVGTTRAPGGSVGGARHAYGARGGATRRRDATPARGILKTNIRGGPCPHAYGAPSVPLFCANFSCKTTRPKEP